MSVPSLATASLPRDRTYIFWLQMLYLSGLVTLAVLHFTDAIEVRRALDSVPIAVPWFGALGAILLSLKGIFDHPWDWDSGYRLWHMSRPLIGAAVGVISVLIFQAGIVAVGSNPEAPENLARPANLLYYLIAFLVGYREETFRELIKRLADVILGPGATTASTPLIGRLDPVTGLGGTEVTITGSGLTGTRSVKFGASEANFAFHDDTKLVASVPPSDTPGTVTVTVTGSGGTASASFTYQAPAGGPSAPGPPG